MKLLTKKIKDQLPAIGSTKHIPLAEKQVICIFSNPIGDGDWYVFEGEERDGDYICFGLIHLASKRLTEFSLKELESKKLPFGYKIIRNPDFKGGKLIDYLS